MRKQIQRFLIRSQGEFIFLVMSLYLFNNFNLWFLYDENNFRVFSTLIRFLESFVFDEIINIIIFIEVRLSLLPIIPHFLYFSTRNSKFHEDYHTLYVDFTFFYPDYINSIASMVIGS